MQSISNTCIRTEDLVKNYGSVNRDNAIIRNINISIARGDFTVIMGNSGAGKSTLLYLLSGLDKITSGKVWIDNLPVHGRSEKQLAIMRRRMIGFVFQEHNLVPNLTVRENIMVAGFLVNSNRKQVAQHATQLMDELDIISLAKRYPSQLSGGERQRAAIARALINHPLIVMADEPTGNLNSEAAQKVMDCFTACNKKGQTIIMATHSLSSACRGNRVLFLKDGTIADNNFYAFDRHTVNTEHNLFTWLKDMGW